MGYIVDIVIAVLLLLSVLLGHKRGFVKTVFSCLTVVCAIVAASIFGPYAGELIRQTPFYETVSGDMEKTISDHLDESMREGIIHAEDSRKALSQSPFGESLERFGIDTDDLLENYASALEDGADNVKHAVAKQLCKRVMVFLSDAVGTLAVFILALILLKILAVVLDGIVKLPFLNSVNKSAGVIAGFILGVLGVFILCLITEIILPYIPKNPVVYPGLEKDTVLYSFFLNLNPLILLFFA